MKYFSFWEMFIKIFLGLHIYKHFLNILILNLSYYCTINNTVVVLESTMVINLTLVPWLLNKYIICNHNVFKSVRIK